MRRSPIVCIEGDVPLVLVAPHGGRRDPVRRPWRRGGLRTNDLHTAELTRLLAAATGASALVNDQHDRNGIDLNRVDQAAERLPEFLELLAGVLDRTIARHGRVTLLTVHGWNTTAPVLDVGLGCRPGRELAGGRPGAAAGPAFLQRALPALRAACEARGLGVTVGRRYPARAAQNLVQLFTGRWVGDPRAAVAAVARFTDRCDAAQLELGIPLRWPGPWRDGFIAAVRAARPALVDPAAAPQGGTPVAPAVMPATTVARRLEFVSTHVSGIAGLDAHGARLLLVGLHDGLDLYTHERVASGDPDAVGALRLRPHPARLEVSYEGPIGRFRDTSAFLDLEVGLAGATIAAADVSLAFVPSHPDDPRCPFGDVSGRVTVAGRTVPVTGPARLATPDAAAPVAWLALGDERITVTSAGDQALVCHGGRHDVAACTIAPSTYGLSVRVARSSGPLEVEARTERRIPIVRGRSRPARAVALATYVVAGRRAGWGQHPEAEEPAAEPEPRDQ